MSEHYEPQTGAYHPVSSFEAAERVEPHLGALQRKVLDFLVERGNDGATDDDIRVYCWMNANTHRARRKELEHKGLVERKGYVVQKGRKVLLFAATERGMGA